MKISKIDIQGVSYKTVALVVLSITVSSLIGVTFWKNYQEELKQEQLDIAKTRQLKNDKERYNNDLSKAFTGLYFPGLMSIYDGIIQDKRFFKKNGWELTKALCKKHCDLGFSKIAGQKFSYIDLYKNGEVVKPNFSLDSLEYNAIDYSLGSWDSHVKIENDQKISDLKSCESTISNLYQLSDMYQDYAKVKVNFPEYVSGVDGYSWAVNSRVKYGTVNLTLGSLQDIYLVRYFVGEKGLITELDYSSDKVNVELNYYCK